MKKLLASLLLGALPFAASAEPSPFVPPAPKAIGGPSSVGASKASPPVSSSVPGMPKEEGVAVFEERVTVKRLGTVNGSYVFTSDGAAAYHFEPKSKLRVERVVDLESSSSPAAPATPEPANLPSAVGKPVPKK